MHGLYTASEPEKTDHCGKLKQMTGGDKMTTRACLRTQFKPQFKIVIEDLIN